MGPLVGYARVSTEQHALEQQLSVLKEAGCEEVFGEKVSSTVPSHKRHQLQAALSALTLGDTLMVSKLDRLGRTQAQMVARLATLQAQGLYVKTLTGYLTPPPWASWLHLWWGYCPAWPKWRGTWSKKEQGSR